MKKDCKHYRKLLATFAVLLSTISLIGCGRSPWPGELKIVNENAYQYICHPAEKWYAGDLCKWEKI